MKKIFISQPMNGLTDKEILEAKAEMKERAELSIGEEVQVIDSFIDENPGEECKIAPMWYIGKSIVLMSNADIIYFGRGWKKARGCLIEHKIAKEYGMEIIEDL